MGVVAAYLAGDLIYSLIDSGIANILALKTYRHGTSVVNLIGIRIFGGDPTHGGKSSGSTGTSAYEDKPEDCKGRFYLFKDNVETYNGAMVSNQASYRLCPRKHVWNSSYYFAKSILPNHTVSDYLALLPAIAEVILTPTLRFRFSKINSSDFFDDTAYLENKEFPLSTSQACYTTKKVEAWRIGIFGSIITGVNGQWLVRAKENPHKIKWGIIQLVSAAGLAILLSPLLKSNRGAGLVGALTA